MESSVKKITNIRPPVVASIIAPDKLNKPVLYSHKEATQNIINAQIDVYKTTKKAEFSDRYSTPKSVFWTLGASALAIAYPFVKKLIKK